MAKDREIACIHYQYEGACDLGREGIFRKTCQTCKSYKAVKGGKPARPNLKREKTEKFLTNKKNWE